MSTQRKRTTIPAGDRALLGFSQNASTRVTATPTVFGLNATFATSLADATDLFATTLAACDPAHRNKTAVVAKNEAKSALLVVLRQMISLTEGAPGVTDDQRQQLGIAPRKQPSPIPVPEFIPNLDVVSVTGYTVQLRAHGDDTARRSFPSGVKGIQLYSFIGDVAPTDPEAWRFEGAQTVPTITVSFPDSTASSAKVWFRACFFNPRNQCGDACDPISTRLAYAPSRMAA